MAKFKDTNEMFDYYTKQAPFSIYQTEFGFLKLNEVQKGLIRKKSFTPGQHIFAYVSEDSNGIKFIEVSADHPHAFDKFVDKHEKTSLAYTYLGVSNDDGKVGLDPGT